MFVEPNHIFNLMDTNGRRSDVLNALKVYLEILEELKETWPSEKWGTYPASLAQFLFYEKALEKSKDVFRVHRKYDAFVQALGAERQTFIDRDEGWVQKNFARFARVLDESIEKRARHYTSNLVKMGFSTEDRNITEAGYAYLRGSVQRDALEGILPLDNINIALLRQLAKLKIFGESRQGRRQYYAPFLMALTLLLEGKAVSGHTFEIVVQGLSPYANDSLKEAIRSNSVTAEQLEEIICDINITLPGELAGKSDLDYAVFQTVFKSSKSNATISKAYYAFFCALRDFLQSRSQGDYERLLECFDREDAPLINKAFGCGRAVFDIGNRGNHHSLEEFLEKNAGHPLLCATEFISAFYTTYARSKWIDGIREYSDTTLRLLGATGLFKFKRLPELAYQEVLSRMFCADRLREHIFGEMTEDEYRRYEKDEDCYLGKNVSIANIFHYSAAEVETITQQIEDHLGVTTAAAANELLVGQKSADFAAHIRSKYPREKVIELLALFSDRRNDLKIKKEVNDAATVPTIYEYIVGIAWYYLSNEEFDLYNSFNLTLNADFEPVIHAGGGEGDIVIHYPEIVVMLEVTLMKKQVQKRGEWEPVLRHSLNLKADNEPKETITFFIADELDYNTINIWRAVASASLESTNTHVPVDGVVIMPFTSLEIRDFLQNNVYYKKIVNAVKTSFASVPAIANTAWREEIMENLSD